jgi:hypothetical protein
MNINYLVVLAVILAASSIGMAQQADREISAVIEPQQACTLSVSVAAGTVDWGYINPSALPVTKRYPEGTGTTTVIVSKSDCSGGYRWSLQLSNNGVNGHMYDPNQQNLALLNPMQVTYGTTTQSLSSNAIVIEASSPANTKSYDIYYTQLFGAGTQNGDYQLTLTYTVSPA